MTKLSPLNDVRLLYHAKGLDPIHNSIQFPVTIILVLCL